MFDLRGRNDSETSLTGNTCEVRVGGAERGEGQGRGGPEKEGGRRRERGGRRGKSEGPACVIHVRIYRGLLHRREKAQRERVRGGRVGGRERG